MRETLASVDCRDSNVGRFICILGQQKLIPTNVGVVLPPPPPPMVIVSRKFIFSLKDNWQKKCGRFRTCSSSVAEMF